MQRLFQRVGSSVLAFCLMLGLCVPAQAEGAARATGVSDGTFIRGEFTYGPHESSVDLTDSYIYSDDYFKTSSYTANEHLATMSMQMAAASISSEDADYLNKSQNVTALLTALGFQDAAVNDCYQQKMQQNTMGTAAAYKVLDDTTVLLAIVPRSAGYEKEWGGNFNVGTGDGDKGARYTTNAENFAGTDGLHAGFQIARNIALDFVKSYVAGHSTAFEGKTVKVWTMGYSRGAATANLIGAALVDDAEKAIGLTIEPENVYAYTFGTPLTVQSDEDCTPSAPKYNGIHNYFADYDPVAMVPFSDWGFTRYGQNTTYNATGRKTRMLRFLQTVNPNVFGKYTGGTGDPDDFKGYTIGEGLTLIPSGQSTTQQAFLEERIGHLARTIANDRNTYANDYQTALSTLVGFYLGESDEIVNKFVEGITNNKTDLMLAVTMLAFYDWADDSLEQTTTEQADQITEWVKTILPAPNTAEGAWNENYDTAGNAFLASDGYKKFYAAVTDKDRLKAYLTTTGEYQTQVYTLIRALLTAGLDKAGIKADDTVRTNLLADKSIVGLTKFIGYFVFGSDARLADLTSSAAVKNALIAKINTAATLVGNAGSYMRVHNNEVILSWLRTMDSYYDDPVIPSYDDDDSEPTYAVRIAAMSHGTVKSSSIYAARGDRVTLTVLPEEGYALASLTVTGSNDKELALTDIGNGQYTFIMPNGRVTVQAQFAQKYVGPAYESFSDLKADAWYRNGVEFVLQNGLMVGVSPTAFAPDADSSRAAVITVLWRLNGSPVVNYAMNFEDVQEGAWYAEAIRWAVSEGVAGGYGNGKFGPNDSVTREQMVTILWRYAQYKGYDVSVGEDTNILSYDDATTVAQYAIPAMQWACGAGLINGVGSGMLLPHGNASRAQVAVILMRMITAEHLCNRDNPSITAVWWQNP